MTIAYIQRNYLLYQRKKSAYKRIVELLLSLFILAAFLLLVTNLVVAQEVNKLYDQLPSKDTIVAQLGLKNQNSTIFDRRGRLIYTFRDPNSDREYMNHEEINDFTRLVVLATEDKDFYKHSGVDYLATVRGISSYFGNSDSFSGGSTVTQQLSKNAFLSAEQTFERKFKEILLSSIIENEYDKETILEYYLNTITFGSRVTGLKTAAKAYFNTDVSKLNVHELAFLIAIVQSPNEMSPIYSINTDLAWEKNEKRRQYILEQIQINYDYFKSLLPGIPSLEEINKQFNQEINLRPRNASLLAPHFVFYIKSILVKPPYNISEDELFTGGYKIYTSLDLDMQQIAEQQIKASANSIGPRYNFSNAALITIDPRNGDLLVMQGSKDYWGKKDSRGRYDPKVNVTTSIQNLGSSLKPFLSTLAFEKGLYSRNTVVNDRRIIFPGGYKPKNVDGRFLGKMSFETALQLSRNLPFVEMLNKVGVNDFNQLLVKLGYTNTKNGARYGLAAALGGVSESLHDHAYAYGALATNGIKVEPRPILRIEKVDDPKYKKVFNVKSSQVFNASAAAEINRILGDKGYRTSNHWMIPLNGNHKFAGKTGTTDRNKQNYFIGYGPRLVTAVWTGNNNNDPMVGTAFGSTTALPIWYNYTRSLVRSFPQYATYGNY